MAAKRNAFHPPVLSNDEKDRVWNAYRAGKPERVPVTLVNNDRVYVLDGRFNTEGLDYRQIFASPEKMLLAELGWQHVARTHYNRFCDLPTGLPDRWQVGIQFQNVGEAWFYGAEVNFHAGQVPDTLPFLTEDTKRAVFDVDITRPLERDPYKRGYEFTARMQELARNMEFKGRPVEVAAYSPAGPEGALTTAISLRGGAEFLTDLMLDESYAQELLAFLVEGEVNRIKAVAARDGKPLAEVSYADDAVQMLSARMYIEKVLPHHARYYRSLDPEWKLPHGIHLCGDVCRHLPTIARECRLNWIDTGFPVDFAWLRKQVGPDVEILGGVQVGMLMNGTPAQVYARAKEILASGVAKGKFVLREANNLPPAAPEANLAAMYQAGLDFGKYE